MSRGRSRKQEVLVGALLVVSAVVFGWLSVQVGASRGLGKTVLVTAVFDDAAGLVADSAVKVSGIEVGRVRSLDVDFDRAVVTLALRAEAGIRKDVRAEVRARSLLGEKFLRLVPQSRDAPLLQDGDRIESTGPTMEIDQIIATFGPLVSRVKPEDVEALVHGAAVVMNEAGEDAPRILARVEALLAKFEQAANVAPQLERDLPAILGDLRGASGRLDGTLGKLDRVLDEGERTLSAVNSAAQRVPGTLERVDGAVDQVRPALDDVSRALEQSDEVVAELRAALAKLEKLDEKELRRILRQEGVLVRLQPLKDKDLE
jgi:phospholipid/cholesterol/gamma-HCH transport system substrate-binding protein